MSLSIKNSINQAFRQIEFATFKESITTTTTSKQEFSTTTTPTTATNGNDKMAYIYCSENNCSLIIGGYSFAAITIIFSFYLILKKSGMLN